MAATAVVFDAQTGEGLAAISHVIEDIAEGANDSFHGEGYGLGMAHDLTIEHRPAVVSTDSESNVKALARIWDVNISARRRNNSSAPGCLQYVTTAKTRHHRTHGCDVDTVFGSAAHDLQLCGQGTNAEAIGEPHV